MQESKRARLPLCPRQNGRLPEILLRRNLRSEISGGIRNLFQVWPMSGDCFRDFTREAFELLIGGEKLKVGS